MSSLPGFSLARRLAAGETIYKDIRPASGGTINLKLSSPHYCAKGTYPKVIGTAGQIDATIHGHIYRKGT